MAVTGPSGSGKSTLLNCLTGLDDPDAGVVTVSGARMSRRPESERAAMRARSFGILMQSGNLFQHLTVRENVAFQLRLARRADSARAARLIDEVGLSHRADALPAELSGGETARAGLAVALAADPPVLIADEPTAEVDARTEERLLSLFDSRRGRGRATLIATHSPALASPRRPGDPPCRWRTDRWLIPSSGWKPSRNAMPTGRRSCRRCHCRVDAGQRVALVGPSGSGKSTLLHLMAGLIAPTTGRITWPALGPAETLRPTRVQEVFQSPSLFPALDIAANVALPLLLAGRAGEAKSRAGEMLTRFGLAELAGKLPEELSGGQAQRVALARALAMGPELILADEPTGPARRQHRHAGHRHAAGRGRQPRHRPGRRHA